MPWPIGLAVAAPATAFGAAAITGALAAFGCAAMLVARGSAVPLDSPIHPSGISSTVWREFGCSPSHRPRAVTVMSCASTA